MNCEDSITDTNGEHSSTDSNAEHSSTGKNHEHSSTAAVLAFVNAIIDREPPDKKQIEMVIHHKAILCIQLSYEQTGFVAIRQYKYNPLTQPIHLKTRKQSPVIRRGHAPYSVTILVQQHANSDTMIQGSHLTTIFYTC